MFNNTKKTYEKALESSGFTEKVTYLQPDEQNQNNRETKKKKRKKKKKKENYTVNPPFSLNVKTNVGKLFFKILRKSFLETNPL